MEPKIEAGLSRELILEQLMDAEQSPPGQRFDYHNFVYSLMEEIVVSTLNQPFKDALDKKVFRPLGMKRASAGDIDFSLQSNYAWPHQKNKDGVLESCEDYSHKYHQTVCSAGGINANIKDMALFLQLQMGERPDILTPQDLLPFHTPVANAPDALNWMRARLKGELKSYYGLGWRILDQDEKPWRIFKRIY
jgi:beta-lactamase class C